MTNHNSTKSGSWLNSAHYRLSVHEASNLPPDTGREVAFAGRSNVGKSSAINNLTRHKSLARTSKTPGRTQQIIFFDLDETHRLVDLPGYGYAKVPQQLRRHWGQFIEHYLSERKSLCGLILLMDARHPLTELDCQLVSWASESGLRCHILLTKADKLSRGQGQSQLLGVKKALSENGWQASISLFSAHKAINLDQSRQMIVNWLLENEVDKKTGAK